MNLLNDKIFSVIVTMEELTSEEMLEIRGGKNSKDPVKEILHALHIKTDGNVAVSLNIAEIGSGGTTAVLQIADSAAGTVSVST